MYEKTRFCEKCGKELFYGSSSAYSLAERHNALCRSCATREKNATKKCSNMSSLLEETPEAYYWIGFLLADGHFFDGRLRLSLSKKDKEHLLKFCDFIKYTGKIAYTDKGNGVYHIGAKDTDVIGKICEKFDIHRNKSVSPPKTLKTENLDLFYALIGGFIDGDGNISNFSKRKDFFIRIKVHCSWESILNEFSEVIEQDKKAFINKNGYAELVIGNTTKEKRLKEKLLSLNLPLLKRKWDKIDLSYESKYEKNERVNKEIEKLLKEGHSVNEITGKVGRCQTVVYKIKKKIKNV